MNWQKVKKFKNYQKGFFHRSLKLIKNMHGLNFNYIINLKIILLESIVYINIIEILAYLVAFNLFIFQRNEIIDRNILTVNYLFSLFTFELMKSHEQ